MTTKVAIKDIKITAEGLNEKTDRRTFSGTVLFSVSGALGAVQIEAQFFDVQSVDAAVFSAFGELKKFLVSAQRALDLAAAEYGYGR